MADDIRMALQRRAVRPEHGADQAGSGIVTCAGGLRLFTCAYVLIRVLRETLGCTLPIQLWHFGGEEISPVMRVLLAPYDVELVDATAVLERFPADIQDGWQLKPYAILHSRFAEVLFLDADQVPVHDPALVFDMPAYRQTGAVFWPDIIDLRADNPIWAFLGLPGETCPSWESGQVLVDKRRHWAPLQMALHLNELADVTYRMVYGDKDTFLVAWRVAGADAAVVPHRPFNDPRMLVQRDFDGAPLFQHRTGSKWSYHGAQYEVPGFVHREACHGFLKTLRAVWNGGLFFPPDRGLAARAEEARLEQCRGVRLAMPGDHEVRLELLAGHQIGDGRSVDRQNWYVVETDAGLELILHDGDRVTYRFRRAAPGAWRGERLAALVTEARLDELPPGTLPSHACDGLGGLVTALLDASGLQAGDDPDAGRDLVAALRLLLRAEPGLRSAIEALGGMSPNPPRPDLRRPDLRRPDLRRIVDAVLAVTSRQCPRPVVIASDVMDVGYTSPDRIN